MKNGILFFSVLIALLISGCGEPIQQGDYVLHCELIEENLYSSEPSRKYECTDQVLNNDRYKFVLYVIDTDPSKPETTENLMEVEEMNYQDTYDDDDSLSEIAYGNKD